MGKRQPYVPVTEHASRAAESLRKAVDSELLEAYRVPIKDVLRELAYQTSRADDLEAKLAAAHRKLNRLFAGQYSEAV